MMFASLKRRLSRRVPVRLQLDAVECGAACLAMILSYYGRITQVADCRQHCHIGRDGLSAKNLVEAARYYGLRARVYTVDLSKAYVDLPVIAHWGFNHFVVIERIAPRWLDVVDPAMGRRRLSKQEFAQKFTGVILTFEPGTHFARSKLSHSRWHLYLRSLLGRRDVLSVLGQILGASTLLQVFGLSLPLLTKLLVDHVIPTDFATAMPMLGLGILSLVLIQAIARYLRSTLLIYFEAKLDSQLMLGFFEHILSLPFRFFQTRSSGDLLMRLSSNTVIRNLLSNQTVSAILDGSLMLSYFIVLLLWSPMFALVVLGLACLQLTLLLATGRPIHRLMQRDLQTQADSESYLVEALSGIVTLKSSGAEENALEHWSNLFFKHLNVSLARDHLSALVNAALGSLQVLSPLLLLWVGAHLVMNGSLSLGSMLALSALATSFLAPLSSLILSGQHLQLVSAHLERLADVIESEPEQVGTLGKKLSIKGQIDLVELSFRYTSDSAWILQDISLRLEPGQTLALVGATGSGKTTLALLLLGLMAPTSGSISYDGIPLKQLDYRNLRRQFGVVLQEPFLFNASIRENITLNHPELGLDKIVRAAQLAAIHDDIQQMPMRYETLIAEGGAALSGGQRQRLAIARALVHRPKILVLDEATSHLDVLTEHRIEKHLNELDCTRIVIAHRLSTIRNADQIVVLDKGRVVEQGKHEDLLANKHLYASLVHKQLARSQEGQFDHANNVF